MTFSSASSLLFMAVVGSYLILDSAPALFDAASRAPRRACAGLWCLIGLLLLLSVLLNLAPLLMRA